MARFIGENESGKLGNKIYYTWHGRQCKRAMPTHLANPKTKVQQTHRSNFAQITKLSSYMKEALLVGFHWHAAREKNSTYALFRRMAKDCFTPGGGIDYERLVVSKGSGAKADITSATVADGVLSISFDGRTYGNNGNNKFFLFVYSPTHNAGFLAEPVRRNVGKIIDDALVDIEKKNKHLEGYNALDEYICEDVLMARGEEEGRLARLANECATRVNYALMREQIEPGTDEAFDVYVTCLRQLYLFGMAMQLKRMDYHMERIR